MSERCDRCSRDAILCQQYSGRHLCAVHLAADLIRRAKKKVRMQGGLGKGGNAAVLWEGCRTLPLLSFLDLLCGDRRDLSFFLIIVPGYCSDPEPYTGSFRIPYTHLSLSFPEGSGRPAESCSLSPLLNPDRLSDLVRIATGNGIRIIFRSETLDDLAAGILRQVLEGDTASLVGMDIPSRLAIRTPFGEIPFPEVEHFTAFSGHPVPDRCLAPECGVFSLLETLTASHPSVPYALLSYGRKIAALSGKNTLY